MSIFSFISEITERFPFVFSILKSARNNVILKFTDPKASLLLKFHKKVKGLAKLISENDLVGGMLTKKGEYYIITRDNIYMYYNFANGYTEGTGQDLIITSNQTIWDTEKLILSLLNEKSVYIDIGANNGYYFTLKVAQKYKDCRIFAFEPDEKILMHLNKNIELNGFKNVEVVNQALTNFVGTTKMTSELGASNYLITKSKSVMERSFVVNCNTLDNFIKERKINNVNLMKVDIEGGEFNFLMGAEQCLRKVRPVLVIELDDKLLSRSQSSINKVLTYSESLGYFCYRVNSGRDAVLVPKDKKEQVLKILPNVLREMVHEEK
jgi:FkbM family methyltransferase